jgi:hypothetical protein
MTSVHLELWAPAGVELIVLNKDLITIGRGTDNDVALGHDKMVSTRHAMVQSLRGAWCVQDLGSRNGTFVRGERLLAVRALRHGDDISVGRTRLVFRQIDKMGMSKTQGAAAAPELTRRERDVLGELCKPLLAGQLFREPAPSREIARTLSVTEAAVQQHLGHLYDKFGIPPGNRGRRLALANEAISRGAVSLAQLGILSR